MRLRIISALTMIVLFTGAAGFLTAPVRAQEPGPEKINELENELTDIELLLTTLEKEVDTLLADLVDPRITTLSVFFSTRDIRGQGPVSIQVLLDDEMIATRKFDDTDRLVLGRGGTIEVYSGTAEPVPHKLTVECFIAPSEPAGQVITTGKAVYKFETKRSVTNFLEIALAEDSEKKVNTYTLSARHWTKEP